MVGSFLNVVIYRVPQGRSIITPASSCPACGHTIRAWENIPVLSWIALKGRCSACQSSISIRYPLVEIGAACLTVAAYLHTGWTGDFLVLSFLLWVLLSLSLIDLDTRLLPDRITLPTIGAGLGLALLHHWVPTLGFVSVEKAMAGAACGYALIWIPDLIYLRLRHRHGFGIGDRKLLAMVGAWLGPLAILQTFEIAVLAGAVLGIGWVLWKGKGEKGATTIPFGPFLAAGATTFVFAGGMLPFPTL